MAEVRFEHVYKSFDQVEIVHDISIQINMSYPEFFGESEKSTSLE